MDIGGGRRTDRIVFKHTERLMGARSLHCSVVTCHGHRNEAHHDGTGLCCIALLSAHVQCKRRRRGVVSGLAKR